MWKNIAHLRILLFCAGISLLGVSCASSRIDNEKDTAISTLIQQRQFTFEARRALAQNGFSKSLTADYFLKISPDSLSANLPYFGRAYQAPMDPTKGGISFTSTHFSFHVQEQNSGGWSIEIIPKEHHINVDKMRLHISSNGYANLNVVSLHRQPISFYGKITQKAN